MTALDLGEVALARIGGEDRPVDRELVARVRRNWLQTSRPGGLDDSLRRMPGLELTDEVAPAEHPYWTGILGR